jgi:signal transduction histidine kinase
MERASRSPSHDTRLRALAEVGRAITASLRSDEVLSVICTHAAELLIVNDVPAHPDADRKVVRAANVRQAVVAPLLFSDEPLGSLAIWNRRSGGEFGREDAELLRMLADQAAIAIRNADAYEAEHEGRLELARLKEEREVTLARIEGLVRMGMTLSRHLDLEEVLQTLVDAARQLVSARYAALGVLDRSGTRLSRFLHSGVDEATAERIGHLPTGEGILGLIIEEARTLRLADLALHPRSCGFPEGHPRMTSFLGVPIRTAGRVFGNLYLTEKIGGPTFDEEDEEIAELLAAQAAVAIENANLYEQRNQFLAVVNHEIKNAAAGVLGWTDRVRSLAAAEDRRLRESAEYALESARQLHKLVVDLLDFSQIEARRLQLDRRPVDLRALLREVTAAVRPVAERRGVDVRTEGLEERAIAETDPTRVRQILLNLLTNALKFTERGGRVSLQLDGGDPGWSITVRDTGPGVASELGESVFEIYGAGARTRKSGSGLGLAISRELARLLGGELSLEDDGPGACFRLHLPQESRLT